MAVFLYIACFGSIFFSFFGLPFATRSVTVAAIFVVASLILFYCGYLVAGFAADGPYSDGEVQLNFLVVLALSTLPLAAGSLARLVTLLLFKSEPNKPVGVLGVGAATTVLFGVLGWSMFGLF